MTLSGSSISQSVPLRVHNWWHREVPTRERLPIGSRGGRKHAFGPVPISTAGSFSALAGSLEGGFRFRMAAPCLDRCGYFCRWSRLLGRSAFAWRENTSHCWSAGVLWLQLSIVHTRASLAGLLPSRTKRVLWGCLKALCIPLLVTRPPVRLWFDAWPGYSWSSAVWSVGLTAIRCLGLVLAVSASPPLKYVSKYVFRHDK